MVTTSIAPARSRVQRMEALERANEVRSFRKEIKDDLKRRQRSVVDILENPGVDLETMKVIDLLLAVPKVGRVKAMGWLDRSRISPSKTLGGMSVRQRGELAVLIGSSPTHRRR